MVDARQTGDGSEKGALAATARAKKDEELAVADIQRDIVDDRHSLIPFGDLIECDGHVLRLGADCVE